MIEHTCNKEVEIAEMARDIKYIRKALEGNGKLGLMGHVEINTAFRLKSEGSKETKTSMFGSGWIVAVIMIIIQIAFKLGG